MQTGQALGAFMMATGKKSFDDQVAACAALSRARNPQEAIELQTRLAHDTLAGCRASLSELTELMADGLQATLQPLGAAKAGLTSVA